MERHHWIPLSLFGLNQNVNVVTIQNELHQHIHQVMNYPYRTYTSMWRAFRRKHNHKPFWDLAMTDDILRMQEGYLKNFTKLDEYAVRLHFQKMNELTKHYQPSHQTQRTWSKLWYEYTEAFKSFNLSSIYAQ